MSAPSIATEATTSRGGSFLRRLNWLGGKLLDIAESVGEGVVSFLGLDDSHFQDVLDNMTEEEIQAAVEVNNQRNAEYRQAGLLPPQSELPLDLTVEDVQMELIGTSTRSYSAVDSGDAAEVAYDIEGAPIPGRKARPIASIHRADTEASTPIVTTDSSSSRTEHTTLAASNAVPPIPASSSSNSNSGTGGGSVSLLSVPATATAANKEGITATENHCDNSAV